MRGTTSAEDEDSDFEDELKQKPVTSGADILVRLIQCPLFIWV